MSLKIKIIGIHVAVALSLMQAQTSAIAQSLSKVDEAFVDACVQRLIKENGLMLAPQFQAAEEECMGELAKRKPSRSAPQPSAQMNEQLELADNMAKCSGVYFIYYESTKKHNQSTAAQFKQRQDLFAQAAAEMYQTKNANASRQPTVSLEMVAEFNKRFEQDQQRGTNKAVEWLGSYKKVCDITMDAWMKR